ncbi:MAG: hypothetical protein EXS36_12170 [Pedosphaera sp.]|nr:hypothetical protein [Pedosphaera sp.]
MRARLFRERNPEAFRILIETNPPVLEKVPITLTSQEYGRIMACALTIGEEEFERANRLEQLGNITEAITAFEHLCKEYPATWIDRVSRERLAKLRPGTSSQTVSESGFAAEYPGDTGLAKDSAVLFADNFESGDMKK